MRLKSQHILLTDELLSFFYNFSQIGALVSVKDRADRDFPGRLPSGRVGQGSNATPNTQLKKGTSKLAFRHGDETEKTRKTCQGRG